MPSRARSLSSKRMRSRDVNYRNMTPQRGPQIIPRWLSKIPKQRHLHVVPHESWVQAICACSTFSASSCCHIVCIDLFEPHAIKLPFTPLFWTGLVSFLCDAGSLLATSSGIYPKQTRPSGRGPRIHGWICWVLLFQKLLPELGPEFFRAREATGELLLASKRDLQRIIPDPSRIPPAFARLRPPARMPACPHARMLAVAWLLQVYSSAAMCNSSCS